VAEKGDVVDREAMEREVLERKRRETQADS